MGKAGRKPTPVATWNEFLKVLGNTANVRASAGAAGISYRTAYRHRERDKDFAQQWEEAIGNALARIEARIFAAALEGDIRAGQWLLARRMPSVYGRGVELTEDFAVRGGVSTGFRAPTPGQQNAFNVSRLVRFQRRSRLRRQASHRPGSLPAPLASPSSLRFGGRNVFNTHSDDNPNATAVGNRYSPYTPFSYNGAFYYIRFSYYWKWKSGGAVR